MKRVSILAMLVLILAVGALPAAAITWGEPDTDHVNVGAMMITHPVHGVWEVCSGTLVHPRVFLTAGHCTVDLEEYYPIYVTFDADAYQPPPGFLPPQLGETCVLCVSGVQVKTPFLYL